MKTFILGILSLGLPVAAGDFVNLTFDQPNLSGSLTPIYLGGPLSGNTSDILRGWTLTAGSQPVPRVTYSSFPVGSGGGYASLIQNSPSDATSPLGFASLLLYSGQGPLGPELRLSQTGTIPADAAGLWVASSCCVQGFVNGTKIGEISLLTGSQATWDVSNYSGEEVNLEFLVRAGDTTRFDILGFTTAVVPEPSTWALFGVGLTALAWHLQRRRG